MHIFQHDNLWAIAHAGRVIAKRFISEREAESWADSNIDDQVFDEPNSFSGPLEYEPDLIVRLVHKS
jgi:hypothetical protein